MSASILKKPASPDAGRANGRDRGGARPVVVVYVETESDARAMIGQAKAVAAAFDAKIRLVGVVEPPKAGQPAIDPVDWDIRRREVSRHLGDLARQESSETREIGVQVLEGDPADQICNCVSASFDDIIVLRRDPGAGRWPLSAAACGAMASDAAAVLTIPPDLPAVASGTYSRVFVPLDGSANAESAIPTAVKLAKAHESELLLCHVSPEPVLTEIGPADAETASLRDRIARHNERVGQTYLDRVGSRLRDCGLSVSTRLLVDRDARRSLVGAVAREGADIVVMASHGRSGHADVTEGDVAGFILDRSPVPVLVTRQPRRPKEAHIFHDVRTEGIRHPADMEQ